MRYAWVVAVCLPLGACHQAAPTVVRNVQQGQALSAGDLPFFKTHAGDGSEARKCNGDYSSRCWENITELGVVADSDDDQAAAIKAALALLAPHGGVLVFPAGHYRVMHRVDFPYGASGLKLWGYDFDSRASVATIKQEMILCNDAEIASGDDNDGRMCGKAGFRAEANSNIGFYGLTIDGTCTPGSDADGTYCYADGFPNRGRGYWKGGDAIACANCNHVEVVGNRFVAGTSVPVFFYGSHQALVMHNDVYNSGADFTHLTHSSSHVVIVGNRWRADPENADDGVGVVGYYNATTPSYQEHVHIEGNWRFGGMGRGVAVVGGRSVVIKNNYFADSGPPALVFQSESSWNTHGAIDVWASGNTLVNSNWLDWPCHGSCTNADIRLGAIFFEGRTLGTGNTQVESIYLYDNLLIDTGMHRDDGQIRVGTPVDNIVISGNTIVGGPTKQYCKRLEDGSNNWLCDPADPADYPGNVCINRGDCVVPTPPVLCDPADGWSCAWPQHRETPGLPHTTYPFDSATSGSPLTFPPQPKRERWSLVEDFTTYREGSDRTPVLNQFSYGFETLGSVRPLGWAHNDHRWQVDCTTFHGDSASCNAAPHCLFTAPTTCAPDPALWQSDDALPTVTLLRQAGKVRVQPSAARPVTLSWRALWEAELQVRGSAEHVATGCVDGSADGVRLHLRQNGTTVWGPLDLKDDHAEVVLTLHVVRGDSLTLTTEANANAACDDTDWSFTIEPAPDPTDTEGGSDGALTEAAPTDATAADGGDFVSAIDPGRTDGIDTEGSTDLASASNHAVTARAQGCACSEARSSAPLLLPLWLAARSMRRRRYH